MTGIRGATLGVTAMLVGGAVAWLAAQRIQATGALQDPDAVVVRPQLMTALPRAVRESSGVAIGQRYPVYWTHNDSGDGPILYAVDSAGALVGRARLEGVRARDFEDMDGGPCPSRWEDEPFCLYIADTGNNDRDRRTLSIYVLPEPEPLEEMATVPVARIRFRYPDYRSDVEAMAVDPSGAIVLVTKGRLAGIRSYRLAAAEIERTLDSEDRAEVEPLGELPLEPNRRQRRLVTGGTYRDANTLVLRTYEGVYGFEWDDEGWTRTGACRLQPPESGGEAIAHEGEDRFILTSEAPPGGSPTMHRVSCSLGT